VHTDGAALLQALHSVSVLVQQALLTKSTKPLLQVLQVPGVEASQSTQFAIVDVQQAVLAWFINFGATQDWQIPLVAESHELHPEIVV
jgi:hypothetical protein